MQYVSLINLPKRAFTTDWMLCGLLPSPNGFSAEAVERRLLLGPDEEADVLLVLFIASAELPGEADVLLVLFIVSAGLPASTRAATDKAMSHRRFTGNHDVRSSCLFIICRDAGVSLRNSAGGLRLKKHSDDTIATFEDL